MKQLQDYVFRITYPPHKDAQLKADLSDIGDIPLDHVVRVASALGLTLEFKAVDWKEGQES